MKKSKSSISSEERATWRANIGRAATEKIAKSEQLNFRLEERTIRELQGMAYDRGLPLGAMIREWVVERMLLEKMGKEDVSNNSIIVLNEIYAKLQDFLGPHPRK